MRHSRQISRRTALRGLGAAMTLPLLDGMLPSTAQAATASVSGAALPKRMAFFFVPNGVNLEHWIPTRTGYGFPLPKTLQPLERVKSSINVLTGLTHDKGRANGDGAGDHARSASVFLTGSQPRKTDAGNIHVGVSVDQIAAKHVGDRTRFPSLELGCDRTRDSGNCDSGYSCAYSHNISWTSPSTPTGKEIEPRLVFERLFGQTHSQQDAEATKERHARRRSLLDYVREDAKSLHRRVGQNDRRKLDEYLESVRQIELRVQHDESSSGVEAVGGAKPPEGIPKAFAEHVRLMLDMLVLAFQTDQTRISTCMFAQAGSNRSYGEIEVPDGHHDLSHHGGDTEKLAKIQRINEYHMQQFAYFLERLQAIPEGEGTLLDQCMIVYGSGLGDGNRHNHDNLPVLLAGRGGGTIRTGRHIAYPAETPLTNLFLSLLDRMDVSIPSMADSTGRLPLLG